MIVEVAETGERPSVLTRARLNAPSGCKRLGELFAQQDFADKAIVMLDWQPDEIGGTEPIVRVWAYKQVGRRVMTLSQLYAVNDIFERNIVTTNDLGWITEDFKNKLTYELNRAGAN